MNIKKLTPRLIACADLVSENSIIADIGTDHAALPVFLVNSGKCPSAIACDLRKGPLDNAREAVESAGLSDKIALRLSDGFDRLSPDEFDQAVMAGMGGILISKLILKTPWISQKSLILQPMSDAHELRTALFNAGFEIEKELCAREGDRVYVIMKVGFSGICRNPNDLEAYTGRLCENMGENEKFFLQKQIASLKKQLMGHPAETEGHRRIEYLIKRLTDLI